MGRDLTPRELYATEQWNVQNGRHDLWGLMKSTVITYNGVSQKLHSDEEIALRKGFPFLGKLLNKFADLYTKLSEIEGGVDLLHRKDEELRVYIETGKGDENSALLKWFNGELDPNFHYSDYNETLLLTYLLVEAQLLRENVSICVYKDTLDGYLDEDDNLTYITVPTKWLVDKLKEEGIDDIYEWFGDYTADDTDNISRQAFAEGIILECEDENIKFSKRENVSLDIHISNAETLKNEQKGKSDGLIKENPLEL